MNKFISIENENKINDLINDENSELIIKELITKYCNKSINNAIDILEFIPRITSILIKNMNEQLSEYNQAASLLLLQTKMNKDDIHTYFATMVPICMIMFPEGYPENGNLAEKDYFNDFLNLFKNKKAFSWDDKNDISWANQFHYYNYLNMIYNKYI